MGRGYTVVNVTKRQNFPELSITQNWSIFKWKKHIQISHRKLRLMLIRKKKSLNIASLQAWLDTESEILSLGFNYLLSPDPNPAFLCGHFVLSQALSTWWTVAASSSRLWSSEPSGRWGLLSQELQQKSQVWISLIQRIPISTVPRGGLYSDWPNLSYTPS